MRLTFLGTGASGGTPGRGRSGRRESSLLVSEPAAVLVDVTRDFREQAERVGELEGVLLTHAHRDAAGGIAALRRWWTARSTGSLQVFGSPQAIDVIRTRHRRLDRLEPALRRFSRDADLLVVDGAMWRRTLFAHLTIDRDLPELCGWRVRRILLTQIGRTAPPHETLERAVAKLCPRAAPAWDGMTLEP